MNPVLKLTQAQIGAVRALETDGGRVSRRRLVEAAKKKGHPLHALFDWNVQRAAMRHWLHRADIIIGSVTILVQHETKSLRAPMYVRDPDMPGNQEGYRSVLALGKEPASARESLILTLNIAAGHLRRAYDLAVPLHLTAEIDALLDQIAGVQRTLKTAA